MGPAIKVRMRTAETTRRMARPGGRPRFRWLVRCSMNRRAGSRGRIVPLSGGKSRASDHPLDAGPPARDLQLDLLVVRRHPAEKILAGLLAVHAADVVLPPEGAAVLPLVVPEVEVPPLAEHPHAGPATDLHDIPLSRGMPGHLFNLRHGPPKVHGPEKKSPRITVDEGVLGPWGPRRRDCPGRSGPKAP